MYRIRDLSQPPRKRIRKRLIATIVVSVGLHLLLFSELPSIPQKQQYVTLRATLNEQHAQGQDTEDSTGISDEIMMPPEPDEPTKPAPPAKPESAALPEPPAPADPAEATTKTSSAIPVTESPEAMKVPLKTEAPPPPPPTANTDSAERNVEEVVSAPKKELAGDTEVFGTPEEAEYHRVLTAHLRARTPPAPAGASGRIRLQVKIQYGSIVTSVEVISNTGNPALEKWARTAALRMSPVPAIPAGVDQPYYFRPTLQVQ